MRMFDKRHELVKFLVVVETGSILGAAEKIAISQPALSRIICKLEEQFEGKLFERTSTGVRLTPLGSMVADRARRILREMEIAEQEICSTLSGHAGILSITADQIWADTVLPTTIYKFRKKHPDVELNLRAATYADGIQSLISGESDLHCGSIGGNGVWSPLLLPERVLDMTWGIVAHESHPLHATKITCGDLTDYPWIEYDAVSNGESDCDNLPSLAHVMDELEQQTKKRVKAIVRSNLTGLFMMQEGSYLSYLPLNVIDKLPGVSLKPLPVDLGRRRHRTGLIMRRSSRALSAYGCLQKILRDEALAGISHQCLGLRGAFRPTGQERRAGRCGVSDKRLDAPCWP